MERKTLLILAVVFEGGLGVLAVVLGLWLDIPVFGGIKVDLATVGWGLLALAPMLAILYFVTHARWSILVRLRKGIDDITRLFANSSWLDFALISLLAGVGEEALFRGLMQTGLTEPLGLWWAIVLTSLVFGLVHFVSLGYAIYAAIVSVYLGWLFVAFNNLLVPIIAHAVYDFLALIYLVRLYPPPAEEEPQAAPQPD